MSDQQLSGRHDIFLLCLAAKRRFGSARRVPAAATRANKQTNRTVGQQQQHNFQPSHVAPTRLWLHSPSPLPFEFTLPPNLLLAFFFSLLLKKKTTATTTHRLLFLHPLTLRLILPFLPTAFSSSSCLRLFLQSSFFSLSLCFMLIFSSPPPATPETGLVYSVFPTSRLRAAVTVIFLSNICFLRLLISLGFSLARAASPQLLPPPPLPTYTSSLSRNP